LSLKGDLDVGDSVEIEKGFEAKGWINIRNPIPIVIYIFIYLLQLLKMGHSEEIDRILEEIEENEGKTIPISERFLFIPNNTVIGIQNSKVNNNVFIGKKSTILGNYEIKGNAFIEDDSIFHGTINSTGDVYCGKNTVVKGNIDSNGSLRIDKDANIAGNISGEKIFLSKEAIVNGELYSKAGVSFTTSESVKTEEKIQRFKSSTDVIDEVENLLE
jgi:predicted acyltransferase (DUF342 family)